jgi:predicted AAA+ superfamily ATPase
MYRLAMEKLKAWKAGPDRKPMIIRGARQVGKTWLMKEFGRASYNRCAYVNLENNPRMKSLFEQDLDIDRIILGLQLESDCRIVPGETLILLDEVQEVPSALSSLKHFCEDAPYHHVLAAGSMPGVALHSSVTFPVGKVRFLDLDPMSFPEFLTATGNEELSSLIRDLDPGMLNVFSGRLTDMLRQYYLVGGMPEAVKKYLPDRDLSIVMDIQKQLLAGFELDFSRHVPQSLVPRVRAVWNSLPAQLSRENRKFVYGLVREGARAREYELAIQWLVDCGLVHRVRRIAKPGMPLTACADAKAFKLYGLDTGLLCAMSGIDPKSILEGNRLFEEFRGALTEQYVLGQLNASGLEPYYWSADRSTGEVDFVLQLEGLILPLEVKASENLQAKSLRSYYERFAPRKALRTSLSGYREEEWLINIPLYAITALSEVVNGL